KFGKWSIGPVGYIEYQTTHDSGAGCGVVSPVTGINVCGFRTEKAAAGALLGYNFGPVDLQVWFTDSFVGDNSPVGRGSFEVCARLGFKIWGPEAPPARPLVSKM